MKKILLSLGTVAAVVAPVASVIACSTSIDIDIPTTKGSESLKVSAELKAGDKNSLIDLFQTITEQEKEKLPLDFQALSSAESKTQPKNKEEVFALVKKKITNLVNIIYKHADVTESIEVTFNPTKGDPIVKTSIINYDLSAVLDGIPDSFKNINEDNILQKLTNIATSLFSNVSLILSNFLTQFQSNDAIVAWAKTIKDTELNDIPVLNVGTTQITLGDMESLPEKLKNIETKIYEPQNNAE